MFEPGASLIDAAPREKKPRGPLTLQITLANPKVCRGATFIEVFAEFRNISDKKIAIDTEEALYASHALDFPGVLGNGLQVSEISGSVYFVHGRSPTRILSKATMLNPNETIRRSIEVRPGHTKGFSELGEYKLLIWYRQVDKLRLDGVKLFRGRVESNDLAFAVEECNP
jgi:hypothetical protein